MEHFQTHFLFNINDRKKGVIHKDQNKNGLKIIKMICKLKTRLNFRFIEKK